VEIPHSKTPALVHDEGADAVAIENVHMPVQLLHAAGRRRRNPGRSHRPSRSPLAGGWAKATRRPNSDVAMFDGQIARTASRRLNDGVDHLGHRDLLHARVLAGAVVVAPTRGTRGAADQVGVARIAGLARQLASA